MSLNNVVQFPKSSAARRRVPVSVRIRHAVDLAVNAGLTVIALVALSVLGAVGWVYGMCQNRSLSGMPTTQVSSSDAELADQVEVDTSKDAFAARDHGRALPLDHG